MWDLSFRRRFSKSSESSKYSQYDILDVHINQATLTSKLVLYIATFSMVLMINCLVLLRLFVVVDYVDRMSKLQGFVPCHSC